MLIYWYYSVILLVHYYVKGQLIYGLISINRIRLSFFEITVQKFVIELKFYYIW